MTFLVASAINDCPHGTVRSTGTATLCTSTCNQHLTDVGYFNETQHLDVILKNRIWKGQRQQTKGRDSIHTYSVHKPREF